MTDNTNPPCQRDVLVEYADLAFQILATQISGNYLKFIKSQLTPKMGKYADIPMRELRTIMCIAQYEEPISGGWIARILGYDPATVTRSTRSLIADDFIYTKTCPYDARSTLFGLKTLGADVARVYRNKAKKEIAVLDDVDPDAPSKEEIAQALDVLVRIRNRSRIAAKIEEQKERGRPAFRSA